MKKQTPVISLYYTLLVLSSLGEKSVLFTDKHLIILKFYRINPKNIEVKKWKIDSALHAILRFVKRLSPHADKIILFGSASRGEQTASSDIDLFVLTRKKTDVQRVLAMIRPKRKMNAVIKTPQEWAEMEVREPEFYQEIKNGITVHQYVPRI